MVLVSVHEIVIKIMHMPRFQISLDVRFVIFNAEYVIMRWVNQYWYDTTITLNWLILQRRICA